MEFGNQSGSPIVGPWSLDSNTKKLGPRPHDTGEFSPGFISFPFKEELFSILNALASTQPTIVAHFWMKAGDQGVDPDPACQALHFPRNWVFPGGGLVVNQAVEPWFGYPIFTENGDFTGNYSSALLNYNVEPPSKNG